MSSPPSMNSLSISEQSASTSTSPAPALTSTSEDRPTTPSNEAEETITNGQDATTPSNPSDAVESTRPAPPPPSAASASKPHPASPPPPQRPSPQLPSASAPIVPGRPAPGAGFRGGMGGPLAMGGRGRGGISKIPASLQAKMDAVSYSPSSLRLKLTCRWHNDHRTRAHPRLAQDKLLAPPTPTLHPWPPFSGLKLFDNNLAPHHLEEAAPATQPAEQRVHQEVVQVLVHNFPAPPLAH
jgi:hypothetical protein